MSMCRQAADSSSKRKGTLLVQFSAKNLPPLLFGSSDDGEGQLRWTENCDIKYAACNYYTRGRAHWRSVRVPQTRM